MNKKRAIFASGLIILGVIVLFLSLGIFGHKGARLVIETNPVAAVLINSEQVGQTPFEKDLAVGEVNIKLVPQSDNDLLAYDTKVSLSAGIKTVIRYNFGQSIQDSSGEKISFEKIAGGESLISVISIPDGASVKLDSQGRGTTPLVISDVKPGVHKLTVSASGYTERSFDIQTLKGQRLIASVQLSALSENTSPPQLITILPTPEPEKISDEIEILPTPTGFLRVRSEPNVISSEAGKVTPGAKYKFLEKDQNSGWYKIVVSESLSGWVSGEYVRMVH